MCPTPNALQYKCVSYFESATQSPKSSQCRQGEQEVIYIQTMHAENILFIMESKKPVEKSPATQVKDETVCRFGLQIRPEVTEVQN